MSQKTLAEISEITGIPARTIRFYISKGLLAGPVKAGRGAFYTAEHIERLEKIKGLQNEGLMLTEIAHALSPGISEGSAPPTPWWQHAIGDEVMVMVRGDISPWRTRQIRAAIDELAVRLSAAEAEDERRDQE